MLQAANDHIEPFTFAETKSLRTASGSHYIDDRKHIDKLSKGPVRETLQNASEFSANFGLLACRSIYMHTVLYCSF